MILFLLKKVFFDTWDNLITILLFNIGFVAIIAEIFYIVDQFEPVSLGYFIIAIINIFIFNLYVGAVSGYISDLISYKSPELKSFPKYIRKIWKSATAISVFSIFQLVILFIGFPFYFQLEGLPDLIGLVTLFWISVLWWMAMQYYFPIAFQLEASIKKQFKKSFIILLDNTLFSIFIAVYSFMIFGVSVFTAFLIPGITVILLTQQVALKLRLYKYDYLEENTNANRRNIPWNGLLLNEKEKLGIRTLKNTIFPWKE